ncbi:MAG: type II toxin-antitoxin system VapC family toxin [Acidobacteria bacterium]|jgi:predicted nucleic acid-binding protein|nr:type II toxin-antitoxin system VapC family toxin [Acidobacteriota bacterium]
MAKKYLLDGNIITEFEDRIKPSYNTIRNKLASLSDDDHAYISIISAYEYQDGIAKAPKHLSENLKNAWKTFLDLFEVLPLTFKGAAIYGEIKTLYEKHMGIGKKEIKRHTVDFILASTAEASKAIIVSDDRIFETIKNFYPSLIVENWKKT